MILRYALLIGSLFFVLQSSVFANEKEFRAGFTLPLSGPFAEFGVAVQNALLLAQEDKPSLFTKLRFILEDDQYISKNSVTSFKKLKDRDQAQLILVWGNEPALAVAPIAESIDFPLLAFGQTPAIAAGRKSVVRVLGPADEFGKPIAAHLNTQHVHAVQMIILENTFYRLVSDSVGKGLNSSTKFQLLAALPANEIDFRPYLIKLKRTPKDSVGVFLAPGQLVPFFKQANELRITNPIFGSTSFESKTIQSEARTLMKESVYAHVAIDPDWHAAYLRRFGDDIQVSYAAVAYDVILAIARSVRSQRQKDPSGKQVLEDLAQLPEQKGATEHFRAKSSREHGRYIDFAVALKRIQDANL